MADRLKYVPDDQRAHLGAPPWKPGPELDAWEQGHGHDPRQKCIAEYGCMALANHYEWLLDELVRLRGYLEPMTDCDVYDCRHALDARRALRLDPEDA